MNVDVGNCEVAQNLRDAFDVVDGSPHRRADGRYDHHRQVPVDLYHLVEVLVVNFPVFLPLDHDVAGIEKAHVFEDAVMGFLGEVEDPVRVHLPRQVKAVQISLRSAGGDVAPGFVRVNPHQTGETGDDLSLNSVCVALVIAVVKWVADIVQRVFEKGQQWRVVEYLVPRITNLPLRRGPDVAQQAVEPFPSI